MKKTLTALVMAVVLFTTASARPKRAEAVVAAIAAAPALPAVIVLGAGVVGALTGPAWGLIVGAVTNSPKAGAATAVIFIALGAIAVVTGLVWLDQDGAQTLQFAALTPQQAKAIGITDEELRYYNHELHEANAVYEDLADDVIHNKEHATQAYLSKQWDRAVNNSILSPQTLSAIRKIGYEMGRKMNAAIAKKNAAKPSKKAA